MVTITKHLSDPNVASAIAILRYKSLAAVARFDEACKLAQVYNDLGYPFYEARVRIEKLDYPRNGCLYTARILAGGSDKKFLDIGCYCPCARELIKLVGKELRVIVEERGRAGGDVIVRFARTRERTTKGVL